jgi:hypothetical protein
VARFELRISAYQTIEHAKGYVDLAARDIDIDRDLRGFHMGSYCFGCIVKWASDRRLRDNNVRRFQAFQLHVGDRCRPQCSRRRIVANFEPKLSQDVSNRVSAIIFILAGLITLTWISFIGRMILLYVIPVPLTCPIN